MRISTSEQLQHALEAFKSKRIATSHTSSNLGLCSQLRTRKTSPLILGHLSLFLII